MSPWTELTLRVPIYPAEFAVYGIIGVSGTTASTYTAITSPSFEAAVGMVVFARFAATSAVNHVIVREGRYCLRRFV